MQIAFCSPQLPPSTKPFQEAQSELNQAAADLNQSAGEVVHATRGQSGELAAASGKFSDDFDEFLDAGIEMAGQAQVCVCVCGGGQSGTDAHLSTPMDRPPLRPIGQIGTGNLSTGYPVVFFLPLRKLRDLTGVASPRCYQLLCEVILGDGERFPRTSSKMRHFIYIFWKEGGKRRGKCLAEISIAPHPVL